ncbi:MAG: Nuclease [Flaviaesturariibacter sp.]|nr:Nuclease [Flaviaesturariibacter sp.]
MSHRNLIVLALFLLIQTPCYCWGFFGHRRINGMAVFLLPPAMLALFKPSIGFLTDHAVDPDMRRYAVAEEGARHYIDIDRYGRFPFDSLPRGWTDAVARYTEDTLRQHGILPWWVMVMKARLTAAFREGDGPRILKLSAEIGHYIADAHVPLHACSNHNGQLTDQRGIHAFWESRVPELLADSHWDFLIGRAVYLKAPSALIWQRVLESAAAADTVLSVEKELSRRFSPDRRFAFEERNGKIVRQYSEAYTIAYDARLGGMVERRMRQAIQAVASFWYTAWVDAGQPDLGGLAGRPFSDADQKAFEALDAAWRKGVVLGRGED